MLVSSLLAAGREGIKDGRMKREIKRFNVSSLLRVRFERCMSSISDMEFPESGWPERLKNAYASNPSSSSHQRANFSLSSASTNGEFSREESLMSKSRGTCFICNQPGHFASSCQKKDQWKCFNCGQPGHFSKEW